MNLLYATVEPLYCGHLGGLVKCPCIERCPQFSIIWDIAKCPYYRGVLDLGVSEKILSE